MKTVRLNQNGQSSDVFRLLIGAVMGLAILLIVLGIVQLVEGQKYTLSQSRFSDGFETAVNLPNGSVAKQEKLFFDKSYIFSSTALSRQFSLVDSKCIEFFSQHIGIAVSADHYSAEAVKPAQTTVFFKCQKNHPNTAGNSCDPYCAVSFDAEPPA